MKFYHLLLTCLVLGNSGFAQQSQTVVLPELKGVFLGMTWKDMLAARPSAALMQWQPEALSTNTPDPNRPQRALTEQLSEGLLNRAIYGFQDGILTSIMVGGPINDANGRRRLIRGVLSKYGKPKDQRFLQTDRNQAVLAWDQDNEQIRATLPLTDDQEKGAFSLQILCKEVADNLKKVEAQQSASHRTDVTRQAAQLASLTNEVRAVLSEVRPQGLPRD